jgi:ubiquinone/menaquinone biosynthesis C-methylase UbiE
MESRVWNLIDEIGLAGPEHLDAAYVAAYDRKAAYDAGEDVALLHGLGLEQRSTLVDLGAGTGTLALAAAAASCARVVAVDVSAQMLAVIGDKAARLGVANVECVRAGFLSYEHTGSPADFVYSRHALHHLPDFWKAIAVERIASMLHPGGVLLLRDLVFGFDSREAARRIDAWLAVAAEHSDRGWTRSELEDHLRNEHSTFSWLLEPMIERAGFVIEHASFDGLGVRGAYVCRRR